MLSVPKPSKKSLFLILFLFVVVCCSIFGLRFLFSDSRLFDRYCAMYSRELLYEDTLSLHYALADPQSQGLGDLPVSLGEIALPDAATETAIYENRQTVLRAFEGKHLTDSQKLTLAVLQDALTREQALLPYTMLLDMPSSTLGLPAQLPVLFAEYTFRSAEDIETYLLLLSDTRRYLAQYQSLLLKKAKAGYAPAAETIDAVIQQCQEFLGQEDQTHFLQTSFVRKCENLSSLSAKTLEELTQTHFKLLSTCLFAAYHALMDELEELYPLAHERCGLSGYPGGRACYENSIRYLCGTDLSVEEIRKRLYDQLMQDIEMAKKLPSDAFLAKDPYQSLSPEQMLSQLSAQINSCFPRLTDTQITVKEVQPELQAFSSPAYYMIPPVDDWTSHCIYINPAEALDGFSLYTTLAHEGFPGHLYQTVFFYHTDPPLLRRLLSFGGYMEGWATYAESLICELSRNDYAGARAAWLDRSLTLCLSSLLDIGIHADGWDLEKVVSFLSDFGITDSSAAEALFQYIIENPGNYLRYYLGCLSFLDLRASVKASLGDTFSLSAFHSSILSTGPCSFPLLTRQVYAQLKVS